MLRKIKDKIKKITSPKKNITRAAAAKKAAVSRKKAKVARVEPEEILKKETVLGAQEMAIEQTKFSHPETRKPRKQMPQELPGGYGKDKITAQVRDPWWLFCYWEINANTWNNLINRLKELFFSAKRVLRVYDVSHINFNGKNAHRHFDVEVTQDANSWYLDTGGPGRSWIVDYGLKLANGEFIMIVRSNVVSTPIDGPSWITDEEWMVPEEMFGRLYGMGFGLGRTSPVGKGWQERFKKALFSGVLASPGITSAGSPVKKKAKERGFWLTVDCELIVYGATEPDADVSVQGKKIKLRPDGTFTMRYYLPDGKQVIPVKAVSADKIEERIITPIVTRETKTSNTVNEELSAQFHKNV
jgi:uncharacterized protein